MGRSSLDATNARCNTASLAALAARSARLAGFLLFFLDFLPAVFVAFDAGCFLECDAALPLD
jgi:hypothetical protein